MTWVWDDRVKKGFLSSYARRLLAFHLLWMIKKLRTRISSFYLLGRIHFKNNIEGRLKIIVDCFLFLLFLFLMSVIILYSTSNTRSAISNLYLYRWLRKAKTINYAFVIAISNELTHSNWPFCISYCLMELFNKNVSSEGK